MINPFSLAFGHSEIGSRKIPGLVRDHRREARVLGGPSVALELKWLRLGQATQAAAPPLWRSSIPVQLAGLIMALSLSGLPQGVDSHAEDSAQGPDLSSGKGTRRLFCGLTVLQIHNL